MNNISGFQETPQPSFTVEPVEPVKPKSNRTLWIVLIAILVLLILCCCCVTGILVYGVTAFNFDFNSLEDTLNQMFY